VDQLDLSVVARVNEEKLRAPPYHPRMMTDLVLYPYAIGLPSLRKIAQRYQEDVAVRVPEDSPVLAILMPSALLPARER
jgi:transposase